MEEANYGYKKSGETSSKLSRGPLVQYEKVAIAMPGIIIVVLLIIGGNLWSTYGTGINFDSSKPEWNIRTMAKVLAVQNWVFAMWSCLEWLLLPLLAGLATTTFCWSVLYVDSNIPGRDPPLPCSGKRWRQRSGHNFHLQYSMTLYLGVLVTVKMIYDRWGMAVLA